MPKGRKKDMATEVAVYDCQDIREALEIRDLARSNEEAMETDSSVIQEVRNPFQLNPDGIDTDTLIGPSEMEHLCEPPDEFGGEPQGHPLERSDVLAEEELVQVTLSKLKTLRDKYEDQKDDLKETYKELRSNFLTSRQALADTGIAMTANPSDLVKNDELKITEDFIKKEEELRSNQQSLLGMEKNRRRQVILMIAAQRNAEAKAKRATSRRRAKRVEEPEPWVEVTDDQDDLSGHDKTNSLFNKEVDKVKTKQQQVVVDKPQICSYMSRKAGRKRAIRCSEVALPCTKYCVNHILEDKRQVLFKRCDRDMGNGATCPTPVLSVLENHGCEVHKLPAIRNFMEASGSQKKLAEKVKSLPVMKNEKKMYDLLENLVCDEVNNADHMKKLIKDIKAEPLNTQDSSDSEEDGDELIVEGNNPGPGYLTIDL